LPTGNKPTASAPTLSTNVTVTWAASAHASGAAVTGYVVRRYNSLTSAEATVGASCSGIRAGLSCTETGVAVGSWTYTVTPAEGNWRGGESARSSSVSVPGV
jgi:hypothetical protein